jgi:hypothetical protein
LSDASRNDGDTDAARDLTREALFEAVWADPLSKLAPKYGLSDVGLSKICRRLGVPVPPRGYWAKLRHGKRVARPTLPPPNDGQEQRLVLRAVDDERAALAESLRAKDDRAARMREIEGALEAAPATIHPLAAEARRLLEAKDPPNDRWLDYGRPTPRVRRAEVPRATRFASKLLYALERLGCTAAVESDRGWWWLAFRFERLGQKHWITVEEDSDVVDLARCSVARQKVVGSGRLSVRLRTYQNRTTHTKWSETETRPLEIRLPRIAASVLRQQDVEHARDLERAEWHRQWAEEERVRAEAERLQVEEQARRDRLEANAETWAKAERIRAYVHAVERAGSVADMKQWTSWAREHADRMDPILSPPTGEDDEEKAAY